MELQKLVARAQELQRQGFSYRKAAQVLNKEGFKTTKGEPLTNNSAYYYAHLSLDIAHDSTEKKPQVKGQISTLINQISRARLRDETKQKIVDLLLDDLMEAS